MWGWWRQAEVVRDPWTGEPWGRKGPWNRSRKARGDNRTGDVRHGLREELLGPPGMVGSADERWRPAGRSAVQVDGGSATRQDRRGKKLDEERKKWRQRVEDRGR